MDDALKRDMSLQFISRKGEEEEEGCGLRRLPHERRRPGALG